MKSIRAFIIGYFFSFGLLFSHNSVAREWYFQPSAHFATLYNDNVRLFADNNRNQSINKEALGFLSSVNANMGVRSDNYNIGLNAAGAINRYISDFNLNSDNVFLNATSIFKVTEKNEFGLKGQYSRDTTLRSQVDTTGLVQQNIMRTKLSITPEWTYALSNLTSIRTEYTHADISYGEQDQTGNIENTRNTFSDYTLDSPSIELSHQWNESLKYHITLGALIINTPAVNSTTNYYDSNVGIDYRFSETWTGSVEVGVYRNDSESDQEGITQKTNAIGPLFLVKTRKTFETSAIEAGYSRAAAVRGVGGISLTDTSFLKYSQKLSDRYEIAFHANYSDLQGISNNSNAFSTYSAGASTSWFISPQIDMTLSYRYLLRERASTNTTADSNAFFLYLNYNWDTFSTSNF